MAPPPAVPEFAPSSVRLGPTLQRHHWGLIALAECGVVTLAVTTLPADLPRADLAQFVVSRLIGMAFFLGGAWLLVHLLDRIHDLRQRGWRVVARVAGIHAIAGIAFAGTVPLILLAEHAMGWVVPRTRDDYVTQLEVNVTVFTVYAVIYWLWRRQRIVEAIAARSTAISTALRNARLHALALELQPHFLHNTLNGIVQLVHENPPQAEAMLVTLGDLLRSTVEHGKTAECRLTDELDHLQRYVDLQRMRFGDRLQVQWRIAADAHEALVPSMLLQPLVENALHHGIGRRAGVGTVVVAAEVVGHTPSRRLHLEIRDDGMGLETGTPQEGTGLGNTRERLQTLYGSAHRLTVAPGTPSGVVVTIELPWRTAGDLAA
jgi:signal transduction histidine kinase